MARIIVIGRNYTSRLGMIRAVGKLGYEVIVISTVYKLPDVKSKTKSIDYYSKYVKQYLFALEPNRENLISVLLSIPQEKNQKDIIIPVDDYAASTIDLYLDKLKDRFLFPNIEGRQGAITRLMDKNLQKEIAKKSGLYVANGWSVDVKHGQYSLPVDIHYPCFPKPQVSFMGNKRCMKRCDNEAELRQSMDEVLRSNPECPFVIEEYINIEREYATLGFSDGETVVLPAMIHLLRDGSGPHKGVTLQGQILPASQYHGFLSQVKNFIKGLHFVGLFDVDSYESNGKIFFNELNLRFGASGYAITASGVNLPELLVRKLLNVTYTEPSDIKCSSLFVNEKVALDEYAGYYIDRIAYRSFIETSKITFIQSKDDVAPYVYFKRKSKRIEREVEIRKLVKRLFFWIKGKNNN